MTNGRSGPFFNVAHDDVDRGAIGEIGEVDRQPVAEMRDVVERTARVRAHEGMDRCAKLDERIGEVRAHEAVSAGDENRTSFVDVTELAAQLVE